MTHSEDQMKPAFSRLFKTNDGKLALKYLQDRFCNRMFKDEHLERQVGRCDVVQLISRLAEERDV